MAQVKYSRQREAIKAYLSETSEHPTADMIYSYIKTIFPNISLGTVYRNLALLCDLGEVSKIATETGPDRFEGKISPHHHFICRECGKIVDLDDIDEGLMEQGMEKAQQNFGGRIEGHMTKFYGICEDCLRAEQDSPK